MATVKLVGLEQVMGNLNKEIKRIDGACMAGLWDAGLQIQRASQKRVPIDTGHLKGSHYTRNAAQLQRLAPVKGETDPPDGDVDAHEVEIGATASYALYVHENLEARHRVGGPKFLERAITDNQNKILEIIRRRAAI